MRIIVTSDWHLDACTAGMRRFDDLSIGAREVVDAAIQGEAGAVAFLGDLCDPDSGSVSFRCIELALYVATRLSAHSIPNFWIAGNHDVIEDGTGDTTLSPLRALRVDGLSHTHVLESPRVVTINQSRSHARLLALPYVAKSRHYDPAEFVRGVKFDTSGCVITAGHLMLPGMIPGTETTDMPRGRDIEYPLAEIKAKKWSGVMMNGHYHMRCIFRGVHIPGTLERLTFGEQGNQPGWVVVEVP
jgi:DNA repair exonuclease SbcCD nuclease subunit